MHIDNIDLEHFPTNEVAQRLLTYVTRGWYDKSYVGKWIYEVIEMCIRDRSYICGSYSRSNIPRRYRRRSDISPEHQGMGQSGQFGIIRFI